jgi:Leucine-rich repeat (LRR) protein
MLTSLRSTYKEEPREIEAREKVVEDIHEAKARGDSTFFMTNNFILRALPDQIRNLRSTLQILHVDNNYELTTLPPAIGELTQLRWLNAGYNKLTELPIEIGRLQRLERLHVNNNRIKALPLEIWGLRELEELRCESNQITALNTGVLGMRKLREVLIDNNPLLNDAQVDGADAYELLPKVDYGDCASCRVRFRTYVVSCTFHTLPACSHPVPVAHYCCTADCMKQLMTKLATLDTTPLSPMRAPPKPQAERDAEHEAVAAAA